MSQQRNNRANVLRGVDPDRGRRDRQNNIIAARSSAREERLNNRRKLAPDSGGLIGAPGADQNNDIRRTLDELPQTVQKLMSDDPNMQLDATTCLRKLLSLEKKPPIQEVVNQPEVVQRLVQFLAWEGNQKLQFEAAWALTNVRTHPFQIELQIASGTSEHTQHVISCGAVPVFCKILTSPSEEVREQAVWALGNIAGDNADTRDLVLNSGALPPLLQLLQPDSGSSKSMVRNATWTLSNFCRGKPAPPFELTRVALPTLKHLIMQNGDPDDEILTDACWALSYLSDGPNERIQSVVQANITRRLVELLLYDKDAVLVPALRTVGNIVTGTDEQTQSVINCQALQALYGILSNPQRYKKSILKEACWTVSNITAGTKDQISAVLQSGCVDPIVQLLKSGELEIKREAAWAISNATSGGEQTQIQQLVQYGCIPPLCELLRVMDQRVVQVALEGLKNILTSGERLKDMPGSTNQNVYGVMLEEAGGLDLLENLQNHSVDEIANKALEILTGFFEATTDVDADGAAPVVGQQGMYGFGGGRFGGNGAFGGSGIQEDSAGSGGEAAFNFGGV